MNILVLLKEVPVVSDIKIDKEKLTIDRSGAGKMMNPADRHAIEAALTLAGLKGGSVTAMTMGPSSSESILREAAAMGVSAGIQLTDNAYAGSDTLATAKVLKKAADAYGPFEAIFCGAASIDGVTGQIAAKLGTLLGYGILTNASGMEFTDNGISIERKAGTGYEKLAADFPLICSVTDEVNSPRNVTLKGRTAAKKLEVQLVGNVQLGLSEEDLKSPSKVLALFPPMAPQKGQMISSATLEDAALELVDILQTNKYI